MNFKIYLKVIGEYVLNLKLLKRWEGVFFVFLLIRGKKENSDEYFFKKNLYVWGSFWGFYIRVNIKVNY